MRMGKLQGKVAVITGGSTGIGLATAKCFVSEGGYVFITGRRKKELDDAVQEIGDNVTGVQGDVADLADLDHLYETVKMKGQIDVVVANAGVGAFATPMVNAQPLEIMETLASSIPMGRPGLPDEVAKAALFLASDDSSFVTGIELFVDGGRAQI
jgi:NAD(P)-dependent dehydrogenase (short-subunit alcohol dehydrogenase family)